MCDFMGNYISTICIKSKCIRFINPLGVCVCVFFSSVPSLILSLAIVYVIWIEFKFSTGFQLVDVFCFFFSLSSSACFIRDANARVKMTHFNGDATKYIYKKMPTNLLRFKSKILLIACLHFFSLSVESIRLNWKQDRDVLEKNTALGNKLY